jgi:predicted esterase
MKFSWLFPAAVCLAISCAMVANSADPNEKPSSFPPNEVELKTINERINQLGQRLDDLRKMKVTEPYLAEIEVFHKAAVWAVKHNEFPRKESVEWTLAILDHGLLRASQQARGEAPWLYQAGLTIPRGYRSQVDGSVQPYAVTYPTDYGKGPPTAQRRWRLDVVLHGRADKMNEVEFLYKHLPTKAPLIPRELDAVRLEIYGRGNNGYRWAGETDFIEAIDKFLAIELLLGRGLLHDPDRTLLRGFSMGGAGAWHLGLHMPDKWCVLGPGAGFTTTHGYVPDLPAKLPPYQEACLSIYDAADYAENAGMVNVVAYAGSEDPQLKAAKTIQERLKGLDIKMTLLEAPGLGHTFPVEWQKKAEDEYAKYLKTGRPLLNNPIKVRFVTYTLKYPTCYWVVVFALDRHYEKAEVEAEQKADGFVVKTTNVRGLRLQLWPSAVRQKTTTVIDGQTIQTMPYQELLSDKMYIYLEKKDGKWKPTVPEVVLTERLRHPQKYGGQHGPIDDAFTRPFLCVRGTGTAWHPATQAYAEANLKRFSEEWSKYMRGELPVKKDSEIGPEEFASSNLILFGDPGSNSVIDLALSGLPIKWERNKITWNGKEYASAEHVPVLIFPSPFNPDKYIVLNSGHTFHAEDFKGSNALLFPRLGDYALLKLTGGEKDPLGMEVVEEGTGLFDEFWRMPGAPEKKNQEKTK